MFQGQLLYSVILYAIVRPLASVPGMTLTSIVRFMYSEADNNRHITVLCPFKTRSELSVVYFMETKDTL